MFIFFRSKSLKLLLRSFAHYFSQVLVTVSFRKQRNEFHKFLEQQDVGPDLDKFVVTGQC